MAKRDEQLQISITIESEIENSSDLVPDATPGEIVQYGAATIESQHGYQIKMGGLLVRRRTRSHNPAWPERGVTSTIGDAYSIIQSSIPEGSPDYYTDWIVGFPTEDWMWPGTTHVERRARYVRRHGDGGWEVNSELMHQESTRSDHAEIVLNTKNIGQVLLGRTGSLDRGFITYRSPLPDLLTIDAVRQAAGFAFGRWASSLGSTAFTREGYICNGSSNSPYIPGGIRNLPQGAMPPAPLWSGQYGNLLDIGPLQTLASALVSNHDTLDLQQFYWLYWHGRYGTLDLAAGEYGSAIEYLRRKYYEDESRAEKRGIIPKLPWQKLLKDLRGALAKHEQESNIDVDWEVLRNKLNSLNQMPSAKANERFFEDLGLRIGAVENEAMRLRNHASHGIVPNPEENARWLHRLRALQTLVNRVILAMTGGAPRYIDYSTIGFPIRSLHDPQGGPRDDGVSA